MYYEEFRSEEHKVRVVVGASTMAGPVGECIWLTSCLPGLVVECEVECYELTSIRVRQSTSQLDTRFTRLTSTTSRQSGGKGQHK